MIVNKNPAPQSSFLSMEKDMGIITNMVLKNPRLKKLLYYTTTDCLSRPALTEDQALELFGKNIKIIPKIYIDNSVLNYIIISFDNFTPNASNPEFRDNIIEFNIICHFDQWKLKDFQLRPYRIAAEIDSMFNDKHLTGIGTLKFLGANQMILNSEYAGLSLMYSAIHGDEDKWGLPEGQNQEIFVQEYKDMFWNK